MSVRRRAAVVVAVCSVVLGTTVGVGGATADHVTVEGRIALPVSNANEDPHCVTDALGAAQQGVAGWTIETVTPGAAFGLTTSDALADFDIFFYASAEDCAAGTAPIQRFAVAGDEIGIVPAGASVALVIMWLGADAPFTYQERPAPADEPVQLPDTIEDPGPRETTVVAVVDYGFTPYHWDFVGHQHPWNVDADPDNDLDFRNDPSTYVAGYPGATPLDITIPLLPNDDVGELYEADAAVWAQFEVSEPGAPKLYRFPGTKIIGAMNWEDDEDGFFDVGDSHGTRSAASAAGNIHGTCPECLFVLIHNATTEALAWAASQPWIDVVTNSYGHSTVGGRVRDNVYFGAPVEATRAAAESGQTIVFSAGNGLANAFDVPMFTYWSSEKGPDWMVTVGAVEPDQEQTYSGAGKPVDISSYGLSYPSTGAGTVTAEGTHSGTSNAAPTVAGTIARVIQRAREVLGDTTGGHADGVVARAPEPTITGSEPAGKDAGHRRDEDRGRDGEHRRDDGNGGTIEEPSYCAATDPDCPLADGVLTAVEARQVVFENVLPSEFSVPVSPYPWWPSTDLAYYYQGHGVVYGRLDPAAYETEQARFFDVLTGAATSLERPAGERTWMQVDSRCRQRLWGTWSGGYFDGATDPAPDPVTDPIAWMYNGWCSHFPQNAFADMG